MMVARRDGQHQPQGQWIRREKRLALYIRDEFHCVYCGRNLHDANPQDITLDHLQARAAGGGNGEGNLVTACRSCNCARQDTVLHRWITDAAHRARIRAQARKSIARHLVLARDLIATGTYA
jgi:5-methylcytosine-specific restriction endonuclease McrA